MVPPGAAPTWLVPSIRGTFPSAKAARLLILLLLACASGLRAAAGRGSGLVTSADTLRDVRYPFIETGYRPLADYKDLLWSLFYVHNQSGNVWTHLVPLLVIAGKSLFGQAARGSTLGTRAYRALSLLSIAGAFACSVLNHLLYDHKDESVRRWIYKWDIYGIYGNLFAYAYIVLACLGPLGSLCAVPFALAVLAGYHVLCAHKLFSVYSVRTSMGRISPKTCIIALFVLVIVTTMTWHYRGAPGKEAVQAIKYGGLALLFFAAGFVIFETHFPECTQPGAYDYLGHSHQYFHLVITLSLFYQYKSVRWMTKAHHKVH